MFLTLSGEFSICCHGNSLHVLIGNVFEVDCESRPCPWPFSSPGDCGVMSLAELLAGRASNEETVQMQINS